MTEDDRRVVIEDVLVVERGGARAVMIEDREVARERGVTETRVEVDRRKERAEEEGGDVLVVRVEQGGSVGGLGHQAMAAKNQVEEEGT